MIFTKKKRHQHASADLSEQAMSDSLKAAQVIFQRHAESQTNLNANPSNSSHVIDSPQPSRRKQLPVTQIQPAHQQQQAQQLKNHSNIGANKSVAPSASAQVSHPPVTSTSPLSEPAHAAAALAHAAFSRDIDQQNELDTFSQLAQSLNPQHSTVAVRRPSSRNSTNESLISPRTKSITSLDDVIIRENSGAKEHFSAARGNRHETTTPPLSLSKQQQLLLHSPSQTKQPFKKPQEQKRQQQRPYEPSKHQQRSPDQMKLQEPTTQHQRPHEQVKQQSKPHEQLKQQQKLPEQRTSSLSTALTSKSSSSASLAKAAPARRQSSRTLTGRIPPPKIYLDKPESDGEKQSVLQNGDDEETIYYDKDNYSNEEEVNNTYSSSSLSSSSSSISLLSEGSSYEGDVNLLADADEEDDEDAVYEDEDEYADEDEKEADDTDIEYRYTEYPPLHGAHEQKIRPSYENSFTNSSLALPSIESESSGTISQPPSTIVKSNATYGTLNKISKGNVTYQGTLPDLIPNHTRKTRMEKFKTKLFGSKHRYRTGGADEPELSKSSITANEKGRPVVTTNQNMKFKTTMRGNDQNSSKSYEKDGSDILQKNRGNDEQFVDRNSADSDDDIASIEEDNNPTKRRKRRDKFKRRLKSTAGVVPYSHHLHHLDNRYNPSGKTFNEDKPWKSHNDVGFVTPHERKRYEGMWVSNRCLYLELLPWWASVMSGEGNPQVKLPEDGLILNLVVKDIWTRSNLPSDLLAQIYDKVDTRNDGTLDRKSFVVGMWLVDQCLYGRKLPREIDQQVWDSVDRYVVNAINYNTIKQLDKSKKKLMKQEIKLIKKEIKNVHL